MKRVLLAEANNSHFEFRGYPVDSPLPGFDGNGQYGGDFALSKRTVQVARGAESAAWVYGGGQSLTLSELDCAFG